MKPGKIMREVTVSTEGALATIDFCAAHHIPYMLFDWKWYEPCTSHDGDATKVVAKLDMPHVVAYGKEKGVGIWLYVNQHALMKQARELFPLLHEWGVVGVKSGFVQYASHRWATWLHDLVRLAAENRDRLEDLTDYYTLWAHQIKTPIAAMGLLLQDDDTDRGRELSAELFKIQQYVEMVLQYLRLGSDSTDYLIREVPLEPIVRQAARKYAQLFIRGKVSLNLRPMELKVLTDEKWLGFVVEQVLSNAVKYAPGGAVTVFAEGETLVIRDNGMGIAPEDLPRVFENGYTGCNGRTDKRSTGIGLYLCREICRRLGHRISVASRLGEGTEVRIALGRRTLEVESDGTPAGAPGAAGRVFREIWRGGAVGAPPRRL